LGSSGVARGAVVLAETDALADGAALADATTDAVATIASAPASTDPEGRAQATKASETILFMPLGG
jgi:hypothetical protein